MKFIHCADLHLESKLDSLPAQQANVRREEILVTFERLAEFAQANNVRAVIMSGDMFDNSKITLRTKNRVIHAIKKCKKTDFLYLIGNHDGADDNFISEQMPDNFKIFNDDWTSFAYDNVRIVGATLNGKNANDLASSLKLEENLINIVALHGQIAGFNSNEKAEIISLPRFKEKNIDYFALGHVHYFASGKLDNRGDYVYSGCLDGRGFDETGDKGFVLIECGDDLGLTYRFVDFSSRKLFEFDFDIGEFSDFFDFRSKLTETLREKFDSSSLLKVILKGERKTDFDFDLNGLVLHLNKYFFFCKVYDKTTLKIDKSDYKLDKSVRGEFVREVVEDDALNENMKSSVIMCGLKALKGEEI